MNIVQLVTKNASFLLAISVVAGLLAGLGGAALIALINWTLNSPDLTASDIIVFYVAMCVLVPVFRLFSATLLFKLSQRIAFELRMRLSQRIMAAPLRHLEEVGSHKLFVALSDDVTVISNGVINIPVVTIHLSVLLGCIAYVGYLSMPLLLLMLLAIAVGVIIYLVLMAKANHSFRVARELQNDLFKHFKELVFAYNFSS